MIRFLPILLIGSLTAAEQPHDFLRFSNGDRLDGQFDGLTDNGALLWKRQDVAEPVQFKADQIRQIVLNAGQARKPIEGLSSVTFVNGDRIPGNVTSLNSQSLSLDSQIAGPLTIARTQVAMISPNPLGGKLLYHGPFSDEGWKEKESKASLPSIPVEGNLAPKPDEPSPEESHWTYNSGFWYSRKSTNALVHDVGLGDRNRIRFHLAWKNRLSLAIAFHADLTEPAEKKDDPRAPRFNGSTNQASLFGNSYALSLYSNYLMLSRCLIDKDGNPQVERVQSATNSLRLPDTGEALVEIRTNRQTGDISLFINDEFVIQWDESPDANNRPFAGKGNAIGFQVLSQNLSVRISDLTVSEWNGMPDAARSLQTDEQDIVLMTNGADRFSGEVTSVSDNRLKLKSRYGEFEFDLAEVSEVRFARNHLAKPEPSTAKQLAVRFQPFGKISGSPLQGDSKSLELNSPLFGKVRVGLEQASMIDLKNTNSFLDDWDPQY